MGWSGGASGGPSRWLKWGFTGAGVRNKLIPKYRVFFYWTPPKKTESEVLYKMPDFQLKGLGIYPTKYELDPPSCDCLFQRLSVSLLSLTF